MTMDFTCQMARALEPDLRWLARRIAENVSAALPDLPVDGVPGDDDPIEVGDSGDWGWSMLFGHGPAEAAGLDSAQTLWLLDSAHARISGLRREAA